MKEEMRTADLWLSAYLLVKGADLIELKKNPARPDQTIMSLTGDSLKKDAKAYLINGQVPLLSFRQIFLDLKHSIYRQNGNMNMRGNVNERERDF